MKKPKVKNQLTCARQILNFSTIKQTDRFDKPRFNPELLKTKLPISSPSMVAMLENIKELDRKDYNTDKKLYKHYIYSSIGNGYGSKIIVSSMASVGYTILNKAIGSKIILDPELLLTEDQSKVAVLSSTALFNKPTTPKITKEILSIFNKRPENVYGDLVRFIVLDSGFKEGVDLFDVKYIHIFEDQLTESDKTQSWGRALRYCGQNNLPFIKNKGWKVYVYNYSVSKTIPRDIFKFNFFEKKESIIEYLKKQDPNISCKINFENSITELIKKNSIDYILNKNVNNYL